MARKDAKKVKVKRKRDATGMMLSAVILFTLSSGLLLTIKDGAFDPRALLPALLLPLAALVSVRVIAPVLRADALLVMLMSFLCGLGVIVLYGLSPERGLRQLALYGLGLPMFVLCAALVRHIRAWRTICLLLIPASLALLVLPVLIGQETFGAKNWISVPLAGSFQPSEIVKLALLIVLARFFGTMGGLRRMLPGLLFAVGCLGLLMLQKDLGTALMYYLVTLLMYWAASSNLPLTLVGAAGGCGAAVIGYQMFAHVRTRVAIWQNPWSDALDKGYQIVQALMAIGSGGLFGLGLGLGQSRSIPAYSTDFVFAVICEQFGILFGLLVVGMYVILVLRGVYISLQARGAFLALLALGGSLLLGLQTFVIIGGVVKLIPLTGITMPFVSYGGTSLISCMGVVGMLCGVGARNADERAMDAQLAGERGLVE